MWYIVNPFSDFFRPLGMLAYWIFWRLFSLNPLPYHLFAWGLHVANVVLLYRLVCKITGSRYGAALGALLFGFRANFTDIYWSFGTIFELLACLLVLAALLIYTEGLKTSRLIVAGLLYLLAIKSKEMAITLPMVFLLYDTSIRKLEWNRRWTFWYSGLAVLAVAYGYSKFTTMSSDSPTNPYYMDISVLTLGRGYGWYFDHLFDVRFRWGGWIIASVLLAASFLYKRDRRGLFFLAYVFLTLLPVVFLVNHRYEFFWYIPFFGIAGLIALITAAFEKTLRRRVPSGVLVTAGVVIFCIIAPLHYFSERRRSLQVAEIEQSISDEYRRLVAAIRLLPQPPAEETIYYDSLPSHFTPDMLTPATQVALRRTDVQAMLVDVFPDPCRYCVHVR
jgi:hypothetical protein